MDNRKHHYEHDVIKWDGHAYPAMWIELFPGTEKAEWQYVTISALWDRLAPLVESSTPNKAAVNLDEKIFYYLSGEEFQLPVKEIRKILENVISE